MNADWGEREKSLMHQRGHERREGRHAASKIRRVVGPKMVIEDSKRYNIAAVRKRLKRVRGERLIRKALDSILYKRAV